MVKITDLLTPTRIIPELHAADKDDLLRKLAICLSSDADVATETILAAVTTKAALPPLMLRGGVSLFHTIVEGLDRPLVSFARLRTPLILTGTDYCATDLALLLASPAEKTGTHLRALACLARRVRRPDVLKHIRATKSRDVMYLALTSDEWRALPFESSSTATDGLRQWI
jgi:PTS system nitrogen regulatory IIA component